MDDRKLKEYALKIFQGVNGYSLNKAFSLFPKYYPKIAFYYSQLMTNKQKELTTKTIQVLGITKSIKLREIVVESNKIIEQFTAYVTYYIKSLDVYERGFIEEADLLKYKEETFNKYAKILDDVRIIDKTNQKAFNTVVKEAEKYGFNSIFLEVMEYLRNNHDFLYQVIDTEYYYAKRIEQYQIDI